MAIKHMHNNLQSGVTLIEMIVVVAIIAVVSSVMLFNYSDFSTNVSVRNLSQEVALTVRKAQTYATSIRPIDGTNGLNSLTFPGYGISFATSDAVVSNTSTVDPNPKQFILFADMFADPSDSSAGTYDAGSACGDPQSGSGECIESIGINTADKIVSICGKVGSEPIVDSDCYTTARVDITFRRPSPDALLYLTTPSSTRQMISYAVINLESLKGLKRSVVVWNTGQISIQ